MIQILNNKCRGVEYISVIYRGSETTIINVDIFSCTFNLCSGSVQNVAIKSDYIKMSCSLGFERIIIIFK
jgi:hypothetical protein